MFKNLLGNGSRAQEHAEMQSVLQQMQEAIGRFEALTHRAEQTGVRLQQLGGPVEKVSGDVDTLVARLAEFERRFDGLVQIAKAFDGLDERASGLAQRQHKAEAQIAGALENAERIRSTFEDLSHKVDLATELKDRLASFLEVEKPFQELRSLAGSVRGQVEAATDHVTRVREQQERGLDAQKLAHSRMEALDHRREELSRDLQDKERRVANVEQTIRGLDGVQDFVDSLRRDFDTLKATGDFVAQKTAALEVQREAVEAAVARADQLDRAMRQIDAGVHQQQQNEAALAALQDQVSALRSLHEKVVERSAEMAQLQRATDEQEQTIQGSLTLAREEMKNAIGRFEFETHGLESISERVADVRTTLTDFENRFKTMTESSQVAEELKSQTQLMMAQLRTFSEDLRGVGQEIQQLQTMRRELQEAKRGSRELAEQMARLEEARPKVEAALHDVEQLSRSHALVKDALEHAQLAHAEITQARESHSETRSWLDSVGSSVTELRERVDELRKLAPTVELAQKQARDVGESMSAIESRREFFEELRRRMVDLGALGSNLDERGRKLQTRIQAAEQSFVALTARADEAERTAMSVANTASDVQQAHQRATEVEKMVASIETRCESVEAIAEQSQALHKELQHRQHVLKDTAKDLERASKLRQEAAAAAQQLDETTKHLASSLASADQRAAQVRTLSSELEDRASNLQFVEKRLGQFEERIARWELVDQEVTRSLEQLSARQGTVEALQADLERMFAIAEQTATDVRTITSAHREIAESRGLLEEVRSGLREVQDTATSLDERKREMSKAEERLGRAQALLSDVRSSIKALLEQRVIVDQAVEKAGSLQFLLKHADAMIESLREERKLTARVQAAGTVVREADDQDAEGFPKAA